jgi:MFS transporter, FSR family, fosmidomycin resistance protein
MSILKDKLFSAIALGHFMVDLLNGSRAVLFAFLAVQMGMSNAQLALVSTIYVWTSAASQPVFGWLTDRFGSRWLAGGGILFMMTVFAVGLFLPGMLGITFLILASLGSAAFHPGGATQATLAGRISHSGRETSAAAWFFLSGQLGLSLGPVVAGPLLDGFGLSGMLIPVSFALPIGLNALWRLRNAHTPPKAASVKKTQDSPAPARVAVGFIVLLALVGGMQAWAQQNMITFVPKYLSDLGLPAATYGLMSGLFMGGSALGNVIGGNLADRFGKRPVVVTALLLASFPLYLTGVLGNSGWLFLVIPLAGMMTGSVHTIIVVIAQRILPGGMGFASGLTLGFMFSAGALGTLLSGPLADAYGFSLVFSLTAGLVLSAGLLASFLKIDS